MAFLFDPLKILLLPRLGNFQLARDSADWLFLYVSRNKLTCWLECFYIVYSLSFIGWMWVLNFFELFFDGVIFNETQTFMEGKTKSHLCWIEVALIFGSFIRSRLLLSNLQECFVNVIY